MLGKTRRPEMRAVIEDYVKRISRSMPIEITEVRDEDAAFKRLDADRAANVILLDAAGKPRTPRHWQNGWENNATAAPEK